MCDASGPSIVNDARRVIPEVECMDETVDLIHSKRISAVDRPFEIGVVRHTLSHWFENQRGVVIAAAMAFFGLKA